MKVAGYIRVSTSKDGQKESPENQKRMLLDFMMENNFDLHGFYTDVQTGTTDNRNGLKKMIKAAEQKEFDVIVAKELSRLGRNVELLYQLKRIAETKGIRIVTLDGMVDTHDISKQAMFGLYAWIYESESQRISDRIKSVFQMKHKSGKFIGSIPPYGYKVVNGQLLPRDDYTVDIVREIFDKYLSGWGHDKIARYLTKKSIPTPSKVAGKRNAALYWHGSSVKQFLQNPHYVGDLVQGRETSISVTNKKRKENKCEDWVVISNTHEPIISRAIFEQVKMLLDQKAKRGKGRTRSNKHLFTNIAYCFDCGTGMWYRSNRAGYICGAYARHGKTACTNHHVKENELIDIILSDLRSVYQKLNHSEIIGKAESKVKLAEKKNRSQLQTIEKQINKQVAIKRNSLQKFVQDDISKKDYDDLITVIEEKLHQLELEKQELKTRMTNYSTSNNLTNIKEQLHSFLQFNDLTKEMLLRFVEKIEVMENKELKIFYKFAKVEGL